MAATISTGVPRTAIEGKLKKFDNIITVSKAGHGDFVCADYDSDSACIQAALDYIAAKGGGRVVLMDGYYICPTKIEYHNNNLILNGNGNNTVLDFSSSTDAYYLYVGGTYLSTTASLETNANAADLTIKVATADATQFSADDWIRIQSEAIFNPRTAMDSFDNWNQKMGEYQQIDSVAPDGTITLKEKLFDSYKVSDSAKIQLMTMYQDIIIRNFKMIGLPNTDNFGFNIKRVCNVLIDNITFEDCWIAGIYLTDVIGASVTNTRVHRAFRDERGYGLAVQNACRDITASNNHYFNCRHAITCCGDQTYGIQYNQTYLGNTYSYDSKNQVMFGMHPSYDGLTITGNTVTNGGLGFFNGKNTTAVGNVVRNSEVWAISIPASAQNVIIDGNIIDTKLSHSIAIRNQYSNIIITNNFIKNSDPLSDAINAAYQVDNLLIENNHIESAKNGIKITTFNGLRDSNYVKIDGNKIIVLGTGVGVNLDLYDGARNINNAVIENNTITAASTGATITTSRTLGGTGYINNLDIKGNTLYGGNDSIDIQYVNGIDFIVNHVYNATRGLILHSNNTGFYNVDHNHFTNCGTPIVNNMPEPGNRITDNIGYNPRGLITPPNVPPSGTAQSNAHTYPCRIAVSGGTVTNLAINGTATGLTSGSFILQPSETITLTYSSAPSWVWWGL